jgi:hypothetical protein
MVGANERLKLTLDSLAAVDASLSDRDFHYGLSDKFDNTKLARILDDLGSRGNGRRLCSARAQPLQQRPSKNRDDPRFASRLKP